MTDGRVSRGERTKRVLLFHCRHAMKSGVFRPAMSDVVKSAGVSVRSGFAHFRCVDEMYLVALKDAATNNAILDAICSNATFASVEECDRIVRAAVFGRVM